MPLFQQSVLKKYIHDLNKIELINAWQLFAAHFLDPVKQSNICNLKEEEYQEGFVRDLFVAVLGYTLNPQPDFNFVLEKKTVTDATKSDGAILSANDVVGVIELKDTGTSDLDKVSTQAFGYKHKHKNCVYVVTSNFEKLRFYISDATDYEEFELFTLTQERFTVLYLCLHRQNLLANIPLQIKQASLVQEENVTKKLYGDYSSFKRKLFQNITEQNTQHDKLLLFKKTQKLLDRFLFIFFAEDRLLLPPNSVREILKQWETLKELDNYVPLYERFKKYFGYLNTGHKGKHHEIFAYNGGLFLPDEILDNITIDDTMLYEGTKSLSNYDFETDVDVNILGHIFEHSLTEIEELQAELEGKIIEKKVTKRKKDGVFYTPRYITKYIVENTLGVLCKQKKEELNIDEETFAPQKRKAGRKALLEKIESYREWLLQLTICDPACGSGAFLNAALVYLKTEHKTVDELKARIFGDAIIYTDIDNTILENNLYGVDINEDAIEIAKLSLWLHTAKKGRKLSNLSNNIKCGNSLIDDATIAGDKAFKWEEEFENVFDKGGFDVVIGNPPYVRHELIKENKLIYEQTYECFNSTADLYTYFFEKGLKILRKEGSLGFISPNKFMNSKYGEQLRNYLNNFQIKQIIDFGELRVFSDASTFPCIFIISKSTNEKNVFYSKINSLEFDSLNSEVDKNRLSITISGFDWKLFNQKETELLKKLMTGTQPLIEYVQGEIKFGIKTGLNEAYIIDERKKEELIKKDWRVQEFIKPFLDGDNVRKYKCDFQNKYIILAENGLNLEDFEVLMNHFYFFKDKLEKRSDKGEKWYQLRTCSYYKDFYKGKILYPDIALESRFTYDDNGFFPNATLFVIPKEDKYLLALLNSKVGWFYFSRNCPVIGDISNRGRLRLKTVYVSSFPVKDIQDRQPFIAKADIMLSKNKELNQLSEQFVQFLQTKFPFININNKLQSWPALSADEFLKELDKQKIKLPLAQQQEWLQYFNEQKIKANNIQQIIHQTDKEIDAMVYVLYGLSEEEVKIVEGNRKK